MSGPTGFFSTLTQRHRRRSDYRTLSALSAATAMLAAVNLAEPLLDDPLVNSVGDSLLPPILVAITCAFTLSSRRSGADPDSLAPVARMLQSLRPSLGIVSVVRGVMQELLQLTEAREIIVVLENRAGRRLTSARLTSDNASRTEPTLNTLPRGERATYFFAWPSNDRVGTVTNPLDAGVRTLAFDRASASLPAAFTSAHAFGRMYAAAFTCGDAWHGRLFIIDPKRKPAARVIREFDQMLGQLLPAVAGVGDFHAIKRRAEAQERNRLARELHDGIVQELMNVDVELELLRRRPNTDWLEVRQQLGGLQEQLRTQVQGLRGLLNEARCHDGTTSKLPSLLREVVHRFGRETGIASEYRCEISELHLPRRVSSEVVCIVQEALVNVKRHSGARHVVVTFEATDDELILGVQDDGRGFPIAITAPAIVADRVEGIGGTALVMTVERGARLEIRLLRNGPWTTCRKSELSLPTITRYFETG